MLKVFTFQSTWYIIISGKAIALFPSAKKLQGLRFTQRKKLLVGGLRITNQKNKILGIIPAGLEYNISRKQKQGGITNENNQQIRERKQFQYY